MVDLHSHRTQLVLTALAASATTAGLLTAYSTWNRQRRRHDLNADVLRSIDSHAPRPAPSSSPSGSDPGRAYLNAKHAADGVESATGATTPVPLDGFSYSEELVREQLARNYAFFGEDGMAKVRGGSVVIVGCGGVGSWAAVMLARSGVSKIRLVDFDYVTLSSLNRHATATLDDVGTPKVKCIERTLKQFARWIDVDARVDIWRKEEGGLLLQGIDWVIDAIDNITTKVDLLAYCHANGLKVFSSMGAGAKCDPTRIQISDISHTIYDPLARSVRRRLRLQGIASGIPVVYSTEVPGDVKLLPLPEEEFKKGDVKELGVFDDFRVRILPVLGPIPATFGFHIATYIICDLAGKPIPNPLPIKNRRKLYERLLRDLLVRESRIAGEDVGKMPLDEDDASLIFEELSLGRSVLPPHLVPNRPTLVRWDPLASLAPENVVVMEQADADRHTKECFGVDVGNVGKAQKFVMAEESLSAVGPETPRMGKRRPEEVWGKEVLEIVGRRADEVVRWRSAVI